MDMLVLSHSRPHLRLINRFETGRLKNKTLAVIALVVDRFRPQPCPG